MAERSVRIITKRTAVPGKIPTGTTGTELNFIKTGELASNLADKKLFSYDGSNVFEYGSNSFLGLTGGTISGSLNVTGTISASTYYNLPSLSGNYLPISGGTVTGATIFQSGITVNTISGTNYIDFNTGTTNPSVVGGRVFFDNTSKALSYYDVENNAVPVAMGQQLYTRVHNATGAQLAKGSVISITGTSNNIPSAILAINRHSINSARPIGVAAEDIPAGNDGLVLNNGILTGIAINTFNNGDTLYLSDTTPGGYISSTSQLSFTARTNEIGYVLQTGSTTGKIYVSINNEDSNLTITDIERNILEGNVISSGAYEYTGMTVAGATTINVSPMRGWIVRNTYEYSILPDVINLFYTGGTNITVTNVTSADATYILINSASTLVQQTTFPTPQQRRENIFLGKVVHPNRTSILNVNQTVDFDVSPMSAIRDLWTPIKLINQGVVPSAYSANTLTIKTSAGTLWGNGIGWTTNQLNPDSVYISGTSPTTFAYRTATGGTYSSTTLVDSTNYDPNGLGVLTAVPGSGNFTNQRIYLFPTGLVRIQYGQEYYTTQAKALAGLSSEVYIEYVNNRDNGILIGFLTLKDGLSDITNTGDAFFTYVSKFGELFGGTAGISTTTLQQAYENSSNPEITTNSSQGGVQFRGGTGNNSDANIVIENNAGIVTGQWLANGGLSATTISATTYYGLPSSKPYINNKSQIVTATTSGDNFNTGIIISATPISSSYVGVTINGLNAEVGNGIITKDCYFSSNGTSGGVRYFSAITAGDSFVWNTDISGYFLDATDTVSFYYNILE